MGTFTFHGEEFDLFDHPYNDTANNERAVEIPVAADFLLRATNVPMHAPLVSVLEVGNVLRHYEADRECYIGGDAYERDVIDKFEVASGVQNVDVLDSEGHDWDVIVSISTLEHVGWEESTGPLNDSAAILALLRLRDSLKVGGSMLVTFGTGYNPHLDAYVLDHLDREGWKIGVMVRGPGGWHQGVESDHRDYGAPFPAANAVWIGEYTRLA